MNIELEHTFSKSFPSWHTLLDECYSLNSFSRRIETCSSLIQNGDFNPYQDENLQEPQKAAMKFKGDVFEVFCEILLKLSPIDNRLGISEYHPVLSDDVGVDGYGKDINGNMATVQIKYRQWDRLLDYQQDHLDNFSRMSTDKYNIPEDGTMLIITCGKGIDWKSSSVYFHNKVRWISYGNSYGCLKDDGPPRETKMFGLKSLVNKNKFFWDTFRNEVNNGRKPVGSKAHICSKGEG